MAYLNKIFTNTSIPRGNASRERYNREYMISESTSESLNTYRTMGIFPTNNDVYEQEWNPNKGYELNDGKSGAPGVRSIFNKYSAVLTGAAKGGGSLGVKQSMSQTEQAQAMSRVVTGQNGISDFRFSNNVPLLETPEVRKSLEENAACTVKDLVNASKQGIFGRCVYSYSDFMYCKYLGQIPNNYLITLRRFPIPVTDAMYPVGKQRRSKNDPSNSAKGASPVGTMVTWIGTPGNDMDNILSYEYTMPFEEKPADWQQVDNLGGGGQNPTLMNGIATLMNPAARQAWANGTKVPAIDKLVGRFFGSMDEGTYTRQSDHWDTSKVYGPIDRIKKNYRRSGEGIDWKWSPTIIFEYQLRAYNGINPRQAMLDLLANILAVTYTNGEFWKGGYYGYELGTTSSYQNMSIFKQHGSFTGWMNELTSLLGKGQQTLKNVKNEASNSNGEMTISTIAGYIRKLCSSTGAIDMIMSGFLNKLGRPERYAYPSLLSESPVGLWHLCIGNPKRPIIMAGNMIITSTKITHSGPLGLDDFPETLKVEISLDRGKPRDIYGIEALYMKGNDRIFHSMSRAVLDMYDSAIIYKGGSISTSSKTSSENISTTMSNAISSNEGTQDDVPAGMGYSVNDVSKLGINNDVLCEAFGDPDTSAIVMSAAEQAEGYFNSLDYIEDTGDVNGVSGEEAKARNGLNI